MDKSRRQIILDTVDDLAGCLMHYDRKEDDRLPCGAIEEAVKKGEISKAEIVNHFAEKIGLDD